MGRKLDALLGRNRYLKPSKFKALANMAISRTAILKNQHQARCSLAQPDVLQLLNLAFQPRAQLEQPSAETKLKVLKEIAFENGITLHLEKEPTVINKEKLKQKLEAKKSATLDNPEVINTTDNVYEVIISDESVSESVRAKKFKDVASAAQDAFQATKAEIEFSRSKSQDIDIDHEDGSYFHKNEKASKMDSSHKSKLNAEEASIPYSKIDHSDDFSFENTHLVELESCSSEYKYIEERNQEESPAEPAKENMSSVPNLDSDISNLKEKSSNSNSIFHNEPGNDRLISKEEFASKNEISDEDIRAHALK
ncbi:hypothetical protein SDJN02_00355, partial [Cucurbita argyrosperma subsp. argyrosperma]